MSDVESSALLSSMALAVVHNHAWRTLEGYYNQSRNFPAPDDWYVRDGDVTYFVDHAPVWVFLLECLDGWREFEWALNILHKHPIPQHTTRTPLWVEDCEPEDPLAIGPPWSDDSDTEP